MWLLFFRLRTMSIAVSVQIKPSRCLAVLMAAMAFGFFLTAVLILFGRLGNFVSYGKPVLVCVFLAAGAMLVGALFRMGKTFTLDIYGNGQIRLKQDKRYELVTSAKNHPDRQNGNLTLADHSTVWSWLLILRLETESGETTRLIILFDSADPEAFRKLYVACRWIDAHKKSGFS